MDTEMCQSEN